MKVFCGSFKYITTYLLLLDHIYLLVLLDLFNGLAYNSELSDLLIFCLLDFLLRPI